MKRERLEILKDILTLIQKNHNSIKPTPLLRKSNLSTKRYQKYFRELRNKGLIQEVTNSDDKKIISLTPKGYKFIEKYQTILNFIEEFDL